MFNEAFLLTIPLEHINAILVLPEHTSNHFKSCHIIVFLQNILCDVISCGKPCHIITGHIWSQGGAASLVTQHLWGWGVLGEEYLVQVGLVYQEEFCYFNIDTKFLDIH